ncbi:hypothetical protein D3C75_758920 [compost metagenome]
MTLIIRELTEFIEERNRVSLVLLLTSPLYIRRLRSASQSSSPNKRISLEPSIHSTKCPPMVSLWLRTCSAYLRIRERNKRGTVIMRTVLTPAIKANLQSIRHRMPNAMAIIRTWEIMSTRVLFRKKESEAESNPRRAR